MASAGSSALGMGAIGFGALMIYSAYTGKPIFGPTGLIRRFILDNDPASQFGRAAGRALSDFQKSVGYETEYSTRPLNNKPPGA